MEPGHVRLGTRFIEEEQLRRVEATLPTLPDAARPGDVRAVVFAGTESLFFNFIFISTTWRACTEHVRPKASRSSFKFRSGFCFNRSLIFS